MEKCYPTLVGRLKEGDSLDTETLDSHFADLSRSQRGKAISLSGRRAAAALFRFWVQEAGDEAWIQAVQTPRGTKKDRNSRGTASGHFRYRPV